MKTIGSIGSILIVTFGLLTAPAIPAQVPNPTLGQYTATRLADYGQIEAGIAGAPASRLRFGVHALLLDGFWFNTQSSWSHIQSMIDLIHDSGASYLAINVGPAPWLANQTGAISMFGQAVAYAKSRGLGVEFYPEFPGDAVTTSACTAINGHGFQTVADWQNCLTAPLAWLDNLSVLQYLAVAYEPQRLAVVHEPTTMSIWMGIPASVAPWQGFVAAAVANIRAVSPTVPLGATCRNIEAKYMQAFAQMPGLNFMGIDIYLDDAASMSTYAQMVGYARAAGITDIIVEEVWPEFWVPAGVQPSEKAAYLGSGNCLWQGSGGIHTRGLDTMADWAAASGSTAFAPFWLSFTAATCVSDNQIYNGLDNGSAYFAQIMNAYKSDPAPRTEDFYGFQAYIAAH